MALTIVVPTRNRASLAEAAITSVLESDGAAEVTLIVSDNSTDTAQREQLSSFCAEREVRRVAAPGDLSMTEHWAWALEQALAGEATHVSFVTDRMVLRPGALRRLLTVAARHPESVISYNTDGVDDHSRPARVMLQEHSDRVLQVRSEAVLRLFARSTFHPALPRMLNCIVPRAVLNTIAARFGSVFAGIAPDHAFGFRCLDAQETIVFWDGCPLVHYAWGRSHGASVGRGDASPDAVDFQRKDPEYSSAPIPALLVSGNAAVGEYCFVRADPASSRLPALDRDRYLVQMALEVAAIEDAALRERMQALLDADGWQAARRRAMAKRMLDAARLGLPAPTALLRYTRRALAPRLPRALAPHVPTFASPRDALDYAVANPLPRVGSHLVLRAVTTPARIAREFEPVA